MNDDRGPGDGALFDLITAADVIEKFAQIIAESHAVAQRFMPGTPVGAAVAKGGFSRRRVLDDARAYLEHRRTSLEIFHVESAQHALSHGVPILARTIVLMLRNAAIEMRQFDRLLRHQAERPTRPEIPRAQLGCCNGRQ